MPAMPAAERKRKQRQRERQNGTKIVEVKCLNYLDEAVRRYGSAVPEQLGEDVSLVAYIDSIITGHVQIPQDELDRAKAEWFDRIAPDQE